MTRVVAVLARWWRRAWRRAWPGRSKVEWVGLYTRQSLYVIAWVMSSLILAGASSAARDHQGVYAAVVLGGLVLTGASSWALHDATRLYPLSGPVPRRSTTLLGVLAVAAVACASALPSDLPRAAALVTAFALAWGLGGYRDPRLTAATVAALAVASWLPTRDPGVAAYGLFTGIFFMATVRLSLWLLDVVVELDRGRGAQSALAVAEERLRFSRDVHDVLGRRLSTIAVQAELAAALAGRGDQRAEARMLEVRSLAHDALREARELARGYRAVDLTQELDGAVSLLRSAGIDATVSTNGLPEQWHEPAAWVVREAVTNVLRHSRATCVEVRFLPGDEGLDGGRLVVRNDGATATASADGTGLAGVRARLAPLGAGLETTREADAFTVRLVLP